MLQKEKLNPKVHYPFNRFNRFIEAHFIKLLILIIAVNATGLTNEIIGPDAILYANIAKHIYQTNDWINLIADGKDWLDKPHLPFWITALSFKAFGVSSFSYKLPGFISWLITLLYIYRLAHLIYGSFIARISVLIYGTALHVVLANFDVRAEPLLTLFITMAIYFVAKAQLTKELKWIVWAALATALAITTKGIFTAITIAAGPMIYLLSIKAFNDLFHYRWILLIALTAVFIFPELYCLYMQFDLHPEKTVFGKQNVSGIQFFLWDSQAGRFFNTGPIKGKGDLSFFVHTTLWAFLPWSFLLIAAIYKLIKKPNQQKIQYIITGSALVTFVLFSLSSFQLPHYIIIIMPHFSMLVAQYFSVLARERWIRFWNNLSSMLLCVLAAGIIFLSWYSGFGFSILLWIIILVVVAVCLWLCKKPHPYNILVKGIIFSVTLFYFLNIHFYPALLQYQAGMMAAKHINSFHRHKQPVAYKANSWALQFYCKKPVVLADNNHLFSVADTNFIVYTSAAELKNLDSVGLRYTVAGSFDDFHISMLTGKFLNRQTREKEVRKMVLIKPPGK